MEQNVLKPSKSKQPREYVLTGSRVIAVNQLDKRSPRARNLKQLTKLVASETKNLG